MSRSPEESAPANRPSLIDQPEFSPEERALLLKLAHEAIRSAIESSPGERREISRTPPSLHLSELRGVFTTLYLQGGLRGCVGFVTPVAPLYRAVAETAQAAAFEDTRFPSLTREELPGLKISLSILSPLRPIRPEEIEVGRHGLLISFSGRRGLLLPQVPVEHGWDRITFLEQTCHKAGMAKDAWQTGAVIEAFTAEIFGDANASQ